MFWFLRWRIYNNWLLNFFQRSFHFPSKFRNNFRSCLQQGLHLHVFLTLLFLIFQAFSLHPIFSTCSSSLILVVFLSHWWNKTLLGQINFFHILQTHGFYRYFCAEKRIKKMWSRRRSQNCKVGAGAGARQIRRKVGAKDGNNQIPNAQTKKYIFQPKTCLKMDVLWLFLNNATDHCIKPRSAWNFTF